MCPLPLLGLDVVQFEEPMHTIITLVLGLTILYDKIAICMPSALLH